MFPKVSYTLQVAPHDGSDCGHILKSGKVGAGELMEFATQSLATKFGQHYKWFGAIYLEKNTRYSADKDDWNCEVVGEI